MKRIHLALLASLVTSSAMAAPVKYTIDAAHTYPAFEADHLGGLSLWRGKINETSGTVTLDLAAKTGSVNVTMQMASIDFGLDKMNEHAKSAEIFDVTKYPTATYTGTLVDFKDGAPTKVQGSLTLHGITKPVNLEIKQFKCMPHPMTKKELCGADAYAVFKRNDFGVNYGEAYGFKQDVTLRISVEVAKAD